MSAVLGKAAMVVGAVALVATGVGAIAGAAGLASLAGTAATVAKLAGVTAAALSAVSLSTRQLPPLTGTQTAFSANPDDGLPLVIGRTAGRGRVMWKPIS